MTVSEAAAAFPEVFHMRQIPLRRQVTLADTRLLGRLVRFLGLPGEEGLPFFLPVGGNEAAFYENMERTTRSWWRWCYLLAFVLGVVATGVILLFLWLGVLRRWMLSWLTLASVPALAAGFLATCLGWAKTSPGISCADKAGLLFLCTFTAGCATLRWRAHNTTKSGNPTP